MTVSEAAEFYGVSKYKIYKRIRKGEIEAKKIGRRWVIYPGSVKEKTMDYKYDQWPVSNVSLTHPIGMPSDVALLCHCDMPDDVPVANRYERDERYPSSEERGWRKLPDPVGITLSAVKFQIHNRFDGTEKFAEQSGSLHDGRVQCVFGSKDLSALWSVLNPGGTVEVRVTAWPRFYVLKDDGGALMLGPDRGYFPGEKVQSRVYALSLNEHSEFLIDGVAMPEPTDPGPTAEETAEREESDRKMREEREAHEAFERRIKESAEAANRENNERIEREKKEAEAAQKTRDEADRKRIERERQENEQLEKQAAEARAELGIKPDEIWDRLNNPPNEDSLYNALANLWSSTYAPHDMDGFKNRLKDINRSSEFSGAVKQVCDRLGWTL